MLNYSFRVKWGEEDGCYFATCPEFPFLSAFGDTAQEALQELAVALEGAIEAYQEEGWKLPEPQGISEYSGQFRLRLPKSLHAGLAARAEDEGVSLNTLAVQYLAAGLGEVRGVGHAMEELRRVADGVRNQITQVHQYAIFRHLLAAETTTVLLSEIMELQSRRPRALLSETTNYSYPKG